MTKNDERVNHPQHYTQGGVECIDALKAATVNKSPFEAICVANIIKYLWRYEEKGGLEDIEKAAWYLQRLHKEVTDKSWKYQFFRDDDGSIGLHTPWHTLMMPKVGDMFTQKEKTREQLLASLLKNGGFCPCQPTQDRDTMCPCKNYRQKGECICGLFVKLPQEVVKNDDKDEVKRDDGTPEDKQKE